MRTRMLAATILLAIALMVTIGSDALAAQTGLGYRGWGPRGGVSFDPDQFFFGAHLDLGEFAPGWHFMPYADLGFGDDVTIFSIDPDITYHFPVQDVGTLYVGGLLVVEVLHYDYDDRFGHHYDHTDSEAGVHAVFGLDLEEAPVLFDVAIGLTDEVPDVKLAVGYTFTQ